MIRERQALLHLSYIVAVLLGMCVFSEQVQRHQRGKPRPAGAFQSYLQVPSAEHLMGGGCIKHVQMDIRDWVVVTFPMGKQRAISLDLR